MSDGVRIDTERVGDIGRDLRMEANTGFADAADRGTVLHGHGVEFGRRLGSSGVVAEAQQRYASALATTEANLRAYHLAAKALADAAEEIARRFAATDVDAAEDLAARTVI